MNTLLRTFTAKSLLSWPVILASTTWILFGHFVDSHNNGTGHYFIRFVVVLSLQVLFFAGVWVAQRLFIRRLPRFPAFFVLFSVLLLFAVLRGILLGELLVAFGVTSDVFFWQRAWASVTNLGVLTVLLAVSYGLLSESVQVRRDLLAKHEQLVALTELSSRERLEQNQQLLSKVRAQLAYALRLSDTDTPERTLTVLRSSIDDVVRPLSRQLTTEIRTLPEPELTIPRRTDWFAVVRNVMERNPVHPLVLTVWVTLSALLQALLRMPVASALLYGVLLFAVGFAALSGARWLWARFMHWVGAGWRAVWYSVTLVISALIVIAVTTQLPEVAARYNPFTWGSNVMIMLTAGWGIAFVASLRNEQVLSAQQLVLARRDLHEQYVCLNTALRLQQVSIGRAVHGKVQDALSAAAFRLARAIEQGDASPEMISELQRSVAESINRVGSGGAKQNVPVLLGELQELWAGSVSIHADLPPHTAQVLDAYPASAMTVSEVVREACSNAIRHGEATEVTISIEAELNQLRVTVQNSGKPVAETISAGVGNTVLNELCLEWSLTSHNGMTTLVAVVPLV